MHDDFFSGVYCASETEGWIPGQNRPLSDAWTFSQSLFFIFRWRLCIIALFFVVVLFEQGFLSCDLIIFHPFSLCIIILLLFFVLFVFGFVQGWVRFLLLFLYRWQCQKRNFHLTSLRVNPWITCWCHDLDQISSFFLFTDGNTTKAISI